MKYFFFFLLLLAHLKIYSQNIQILNEVTKEPVPYVTAVFFESGKIIGGNYTSEKGILTLPDIYDGLELTCIGYKTKHIEGKIVKSQILIEEIPYELNEVIVTDKISAEIIGYINKKKISKSGSERFTQTAAYIENPYNKPVYIKSFLFRPYKIKSKRMYRIHLYKKSDKGNWPGIDLLPKDIVRFVDRGDNDIVEIDLSEYGIIMPNDGIYASIEGLGAYDKKGNIIDSQYASGITFEAFQTFENIHFHQPVFFNGKGWIEVNKWLADENKRNGVVNASKNFFTAPSFGLKVYKP